MSVETKREDLESREVVKNQKIVKYEIPAGRILPEIVEMNSLSDEPEFQERAANAKEQAENVREEWKARKDIRKEESEKKQLVENTKIAKAKMSAIKGKKTKKEAEENTSEENTQAEGS